MSEIDIRDAKCKSIGFHSAVELKKETDSAEQFVIHAYTGQTVKRWWGELAIDVAGIKSKSTMPILMAHDHRNIVGWSTRVWKDDDLLVAGRFSQSTEAGKEAKALSEEGFPWQASIGVSPVKVLSLEKGDSKTVNNKEIKGPAEVWLESEVYEVSFVPLGADSDTSISMLARIDEQAEPEQITERREAMTLEELKREHPDLVSEVLQEGITLGAQSERERIKTVKECSLPGHEALIDAMIADGTNASDAALKILNAERLLRNTAVENLARDAKEVPSIPAASPPEQPSENLTTEAGMKAAWEKDASLRDEFGGNFEIFQAYQQNKHLARVLNK